MRTIVRLMAAVFFIAATALAIPARAGTTTTKPDGQDMVVKQVAAPAPTVHGKAIVECDGNEKAVECDGKQSAKARSEAVKTDGTPAESTTALPAPEGGNKAVAAEAKAVVGKGGGDANAESSVDASKGVLKGDAKAHGAGEGGSAHTVVNAGQSEKGSVSARTPSGKVRAGCDTCANKEIDKERAAPVAPPAPAPFQVVAPAPLPPASVCVDNSQVVAWARANAANGVLLKNEKPHCGNGSADLSIQPSIGGGQDTGANLGTLANGVTDGYDHINMGGDTYQNCTVMGRGVAMKLTADEIKALIEFGHYDTQCNRVCQWRRENPSGDGCPKVHIVVYDDGCQEATVVAETDVFEERSCGDNTSTAIGVAATGLTGQGKYVATPDWHERIVKPSDCGDGSDAELCQKAYRANNLH
jgi:hypothetical protein